MTQRDLAARWGVSKGLISNLEAGQRRIDLVELYWLCQFFKVDPEKVAVELLRRFKTIDRRYS